MMFHNHDLANFCLFDMQACYQIHTMRVRRSGTGEYSAAGGRQEEWNYYRGAFAGPNMHHFPQIIAISWLAWFFLCVFNYFHILVMRPLPIGSMAAREIYQLGKLSFTWLSVDQKTSSRTWPPRKSWWTDFLETARFVWGVFFLAEAIGTIEIWDREIAEGSGRHPGLFGIAPR